MPDTIGDSSVPADVTVDPVTYRIGYLDARTGAFMLLSRDQLAEVASVYNNWRCGNFESCMLDGPSAYGKVKL